MEQQHDGYAGTWARLSDAAKRELLTFASSDEPAEPSSALCEEVTGAYLRVFRGHVDVHTFIEPGFREWVATRYRVR